MAAPATFACDVVVGIPGNPPLTRLEHGKISGVIAETAALALEAMGCRVSARQLPFARMYKWIHSGRLPVATSVLATPARLSRAFYSAPIVTEYTLVMVPRGQGFPLNSVSDLTGRRIGGQIGFRYPPLDGVSLTLIRERSYELNIRKVVAGRIDGTLIGSVTGPYLAEKLGLSDKVEFLPRAIGSVALGAALSHETFGADALVRFNRETARIMSSERWIEILRSNGVRQHVRPWPLLNATRQAKSVP